MLAKIRNIVFFSLAFKTLLEVVEGGAKYFGTFGYYFYIPLFSPFIAFTHFLAKFLIF